MHIHPRSIAHKAFDVWRIPGRFTKNPDIIELPSGRLMLIFADTDSHWSQENQILTLLASDDRGRTWFHHRDIDHADLRKGDERFCTPRLSRLNDGRLVVIIDHDDYGHFHEDQSPGNWLYWSDDDGETWSEAKKPAIMGFEPDRIQDLPDGRLGVGSHVMRGESQEFAVILSCSDDGGETWYEAATIAHNGYHRVCEGAIVQLDNSDAVGGKELACILRENHHAGQPSFVTFSTDSGRTWSPVQICPFALDRPYGKQLPDGRVFVSGRHVNGPLGTYGWCGDLKAEAGTYQIGGPRRKYAASLDDGALVIDNLPGHEARYCLLPPESVRSEVHLEATLKVEGRPGEAAAFLSLSQFGTVLNIAVDGIWSRLGADFRHPVDMSDYRTLSIHHRRGLMQIQVDGETVINHCIFREGYPIGDSRRAGHLGGYTQFGQPQAGGRSFWRRLSYRSQNPTLDDHAWSWDASSGDYPDQYQQQRMIQIHGNHPEQPTWPDHGYSSWLMLDNGQIMWVDYTNYGDPAGCAHLVGVFIDPEDLA